MVKAHSSVGIVLYHADEDAFIVVRQFRPAVSISGLHNICCRKDCLASCKILSLQGEGSAGFAQQMGIL